MNYCGNKKCPYQCENKCVASGLCAGYEPIDETENNVTALYENKMIIKPCIDEAIRFCERSNIGSHSCSVKTRYGWCCDICLEAELLALNQCGIHTVNSCCGHGNINLSSIMVVGENSIELMEQIGYETANIQADNSEYKCLTKCYVPKSTMLYEISDESQRR